MTVRVVILSAAKADLHELRNYLRGRFGQTAWANSYSNIKQGIARIGSHPQAGDVVDELAALHMGHYRQVMSGMNRIIYELRGDTAFVHVICDGRRDMQALLARRLLEY